jgi:hypothetical protein
MVSMEEITSLEPGQTAKRIIQARFHHHLLPLKLALFCNGKKLPVKLRPDIGYFVRPLTMDIQAFTDKESRLRGMFEYVRRSVTILNPLILIYFLLCYCLFLVLSRSWVIGFRNPDVHVNAVFIVLYMAHCTIGHSCRGRSNMFGNTTPAHVHLNAWVIISLNSC